MLKTTIIKQKCKELLMSEQNEVRVNRLEYLELLHEVLVLRHKIRRRSSKRGMRPDKTE